MKILFLVQHKWPHVGGVEKHVFELSKNLKVKGESVKTVSEEDIKYPHIKFFGLLYIWFWLFQNRRLIQDADIIHCHDVFIWYLPFRFLYSGKKVFTTFHGWEVTWPIPLKNILMKRLASKLSVGTIAVGKYIERYYGIKTDKIIYGAQD
jgi:glycosyltransferase involved in cell wall biosynthesis